MKTCFSEEKLMKQFGNLPLSKRIPLSTNPPISEQIFYDPSLSKFQKQETTPNFRGGGGGGGEETMMPHPLFFVNYLQSKHH